MLIPIGMPAILVAVAMAFAMILSLAIGIVRIALGVHWPTDVVAGWCAGIAWASGSLLLANHLLG